MTNNAYIRQLDPIQGLIDYVEDIKPYHTKIIEVMIEYVYDDKTNGTVRESVIFQWGPSKFPAYDAGPAQTFQMNGNFTNAIFPNDEVTLIAAGSPVSSQTALVTVVSYSSGVTTVTLGGSPVITVPTNLSHVLIPGDVTFNFSFNITSIDDENQTIIVSGPATADIFNGQQITVTGTASNDGVYTVDGSPTFNGLSTIFPVAETLTPETVAGSPTITPIRYYIP
jgi:hypothetical protein